jgi:hypothetical protein
MEDPAETAIENDLIVPRFLAGMARKQWRLVSLNYPILLIAIAAIEPHGTAGEYGFRFEVTGYPGLAPEVRIWDLQGDQILPVDRRPKGSHRVTEAFKDWSFGTVYRPWERHSGAHGNWTNIYVNLAWHPKRDISFILEDLHGLLNCNALKGIVRPPT